jgi:hypothetical protein
MASSNDSSPSPQSHPSGSSANMLCKSLWGKAFIFRFSVELVARQLFFVGKVGKMTDRRILSTPRGTIKVLNVDLVNKF